MSIKILKIGIIFILLSVVSIYAEPAYSISYSQENNFELELDFGIISLGSRIIDGKKVPVLECENANTIYYNDDFILEGMVIPVAIVNNILPKVGIKYLEYKKSEIDFTKSNLPVYEPVQLSEVLIFRELNYVNISVFPQIAENSVSGKITLSVQMNSSPQSGQPLNTLEKKRYSNIIVNKQVLDRIKIENRSPRVLSKQNVESGFWFEIGILEKGIYSISGEELLASGLGEAAIQKESMKLYMSSTFGKPFTAKLPNLDSLFLEIPLLFLSENRGILSAQDEFVFYAPSVNQWNYNSSGSSISGLKFITNPYETMNHLWLFVSESQPDQSAKRMNSDTYDNIESYDELDFTWGRIHHEKEEVNILQGGLKWYGESFNGVSGSQSITLSLPNIATQSDTTGFMRIAVAGASKQGDSNDTHNFSFKLNGNDFDRNITLSNYSFSSVSDFIELAQLNEESSVLINYNSNTEFAKAFVDYIDLVYPMNIMAVEDELNLFFPPENKPYKFTLSAFNSDLIYAFNISNPLETSYSIHSSSSFELAVMHNGEPGEFIVLSENRFKKPYLLQKNETFKASRSDFLASQSDLVIITHSEFMDEALRLKSHKESRLNNPLSTMVVDIEDIYSSYSSGNNDPYAIRNFLCDLSQNAPAPKPYYVILFGDGSYDYRNITGLAKNYIPQFEISAGHIYHTRNSDDPFVYLSSDSDQTVDMALGRLAVNSSEEAAAFVDKIINYENRKFSGIWQNNVTFVADDPTDPDENSPVFITNTENRISELFPKALLKNKIYLTEFPELYDPAIRAMGRIGAREAILDAFKSGTLIVNWIGHGSPLVWAQEYIFVKDRDFSLISNPDMYPLVVAATCDWGRTDYTSVQSSAEEITNLSENGAIASLATTRPVYDSANMNFLEKFYQKLFPDPLNSTVTDYFGDALVSAKLRSTDYTNTSKFLLVGDPSIKLAIPEHTGVVTSISSDTLKALDKIQIQAKIIKYDGSDFSQDDFSASISLYDSDYRVDREYNWFHSYYGTHEVGIVSYELPGKKLFEGKVSIVNNILTTNFIIPKDISYKGTDGTVRIQYSNETYEYEGLFSRDSLLILGSSSEVQEDFQGPHITVLFSGDNYLSGDVVADTSTISIVLSDPNGINITGSTGHAIKLNANDNQDYDLSNMFVYDKDSYQSGKINVLVGDYFNKGKQEFSISAYDNYNNLSTYSGEMTIIDDEMSILSEVVNFPNPFSGSTQFTFQSVLTGVADIHIYSISGRTVKSIEREAVDVGFNTIDWDGTDSFGQELASGIYIYVIRLESAEKTFEIVEKCVIIP